MRVPGRTVIVGGFVASTHQFCVKSLISSFPGLEQWDLLEKPSKSSNEYQLEAVFDTLEHAQACFYRLRQKKWNNCVLNTKIVGIENHEIKDEMQRVRETNRVKQKDKTRVRESTKSGRIIVRNLHWRVDEKRLRHLFGSVGVITEVQIPQQAGKKRGFAFVQFETREQAVKAVEKFQAHELRGRPMAVDLSVPKDIHLRHGHGQHNGRLLEPEDGSYHASSCTDERLSRIENWNTKQNGAADDEDSDQNDSEENENCEEDENSDLDDREMMSEDDGNSDEEGEQIEDDDDNDDEEEAAMMKARRKRVAEKYNDVQEGKTVFVKNLPFRSGDAELKEIFSRFGKVSMAKVVLDHETEESKGCGFVKFDDAESVQKCLDKLQRGTGLIMDRRKLSAEVAVARETKEREKEERKKDSMEQRVNDRRNLHLARVGLIRGDAVMNMSKHDLKLRDRIEKVKKTKLQNSNIVVSQTRLCVHNVPKQMTDKELKAMCLKAIRGKKHHIIECRIMKEKTDKTASGLGKSLGYAFVSFSSHPLALKALEALNDNPNVFSHEKRPVVEFSLENMTALQKKQRSMLKSQGKDPSKEQYRSGNEVLSYKSKKKLKTIAKSVQLPEKEEASANKPKKSDVALPPAVIETLSAADLKTRVNNPMPKKTLLRSVDKAKLHKTLSRRKKQKQMSTQGFKDKKQSEESSVPIKKINLKKKNKFLKQPLTDSLDALIAKRVQKRTV